ncbi:hypothetical protein G7046_g3752 [Stylonectria norvegica]|nr:hypothetical protein G7046_g3752 [Stylonectria norvegica]
MTTFADLLERNKATAASHTPIPYLSEIRAAGMIPVRTMIVTCLDPRCIAETFFNFGVGECVVHRNAGGSVREAMRDILIMDQLFGLKELAIVHHTDCGTLQYTNEGIVKGLKGVVDEKHWAEVEKIDFGANTDMEASVKSDLEWVRASPLIREELKPGIQGFMFDIKTGLVKRVNTE